LTGFAISALPLGGYVKMLGQEDLSVPEEQHNPAAFNCKPLYQRFAIIAAGPVANFLLAIALYWVMFMTGVSALAPVVGRVEEGSAAANAGLRADDEILMVDGNAVSSWQEARLRLLDRMGESGSISLTVQHPDSSLPRQLQFPITNWLGEADEPDLFGDLGLVPFHQNIPARLQDVVAGSPAEAAGLQAGDLVVSADGNAVADWSAWLQVVQANPGVELAVEVERAGKLLALSLTPGIRLGDDGQPQLNAEGQQQGFIGAQVSLPTLPEWMNRSVSYNPLAAIPRALTETWDNSVFVLGSLKKMLLGLISLKNISGPITIAQVAGETARVGFEYYIGFLAVLSISLGIFNLLPVPVLDGGHLLYHGIEAVLRRPVPRRIQEWGLQAGLMLVGCLMFLALYNDMSRLFQD
jgi:regulator of sigma E protease